MVEQLNASSWCTTFNELSKSRWVAEVYDTFSDKYWEAEAFLELEGRRWLAGVMRR